MSANRRDFSFATRATEKTSEDFATQSLEGNGETEPVARRLKAAERRISSGLKSNISTAGLLEVIEPQRSQSEIVLSPENFRALAQVVEEMRRAEELRRHGVRPRSKLLFCGPPGCGKTLCAEALAYELKLPLMVARLDAIVTTYLGETAKNIRKVFDSVAQIPAVLFLDEFDALARSRSDSTEHNEIRRVVNSLLMMVDAFRGRGILIAATNLHTSIDEAAWRRFDEVLLFELPEEAQVEALIKLKLRNYPYEFMPEEYRGILLGLSYAEIERVCLDAIKRCILDRKQVIRSIDFEKAIAGEKRRKAIGSGALA